MAFLRKGLTRYWLVISGYVLVFFICLILFRTVQVQADQVQITLSGKTTSGSGTDTTGVFLPPGSNLAGLDFDLALTYDTSQGGVYMGTWPACTNGLQKTATSGNPVIDAELTMVGKTYRFNMLPDVQTFTANVAATNATTPKMGIQGTDNPNMTGSAVFHGSELAQYQVAINSAAICRNWSDSWLFTTSTSSDTTPIGTLSVIYGFNSPFSADTAFSAVGLVTTINVSGTFPAPVFGSPTSGTTSGYQNLGCPVSDNSTTGSTLQSDVVPQSMAASASNCGGNAISALSLPSAFASVGAPVNASVGNVSIAETDFSGPAHTQISFTRYFNSFDTSDVGFGKGWHSTYHHGLTNITSSSITVVRPSGRQDVFTLSAGNWVPQANVTSVLTSTTSPSGYKLTLPNDTVENYNTSGQLTSITARNGLSTTLSYSTTGLTSVVGPFGHTLSFSFNALSKVTTMTLPDGTNKFSYLYDTNNNLKAIANPDGTFRAYGHNPFFPSQVTVIHDENGNPYVFWDYDSNGRAIASEFAAGVNHTSLSFTSTSAVTATDALGNTTSYALTSNSGFIQPTATNGVPNLQAGAAAFTYDANGFLASSTDFNGNVTQYVFNSIGEETSRTEAYGTSLARTTTTTWHATFHLPARIDQPLSRTTSFSYDANGNMLTKSVSDGVTTRTYTYTYNANGEQTSYTDALGNTTTWTYDGSGNLATMVNALGQTTTYNSYDGNGRLTRMTNPIGLVTTIAYDQLGRMSSKKVGGFTTSYTWDSGVHKISKITYPDSSTLNFGFDDAHRLISVKNAANEVVSYTYDDNSNITNVSVFASGSVLKATHTYSYDSANRVLTSVGAAIGETTTYGYDNQSNLITITNALGNTTTIAYDALNRLRTVVDALNNTTSYTYDALNHLVTLEDPLGLTTTYTYSVYGDVLTVGSPDSGTTTNSYNAGGLLSTTTDARGQGATYSYDVLNRTTTIIYASGPTISYLYDTTTNGIGQIGQMSDPAGTTTWAYDSTGRISRKSQTTGALTLTTTYTYDASSRLSTIKYPSAKVITYSYDSSGRVNNLNFNSVNLASLTYFPFGLAKGWTYPNLTTIVRAFDQDGRITSTTLNSTTTNVQTVTYDVAGRISALSETSTVFAISHTYGYDNLNRLTSFFNGTTTTTLTYDANGNRLSSTLSGTTTYNYPGTSNRLSSLTGVTTASYSYDALGNTTSDGTNVWTYDARGRMSTLVAGTTTASYGINGFGQRISKTGNTVTNGGTNEYVYDEKGNLLGEYSSTGTAIQETVWLPATPIPVLSAGLGIAGLGNAVPVTALSGTTSTYAITPDWQGSPHIIANSGKTYQWIWDRFAFGDNAPNQNPKGLGTFTYNLRLPGQFADVESGMNYNFARDYNSNTGRYIQADPVGLDGGQLSLYTYVGGNPLTQTDPYGSIVVYSGDPGTEFSLRTAYLRVGTTSLGRWLESVLENSSTIYTITNEMNGNAFFDPRTNTISIDPNFHPLTYVDVGNACTIEAAPTDAILGHEIGHAATGVKDDGPGNLNNVIQNENPIREQLGEPPRIRYSGPTGTHY